MLPAVEAARGVALRAPVRPAIRTAYSTGACRRTRRCPSPRPSPIRPLLAFPGTAFARRRQLPLPVSVPLWRSPARGGPDPLCTRRASLRSARFVAGQAPRQRVDHFGAVNCNASTARPGELHGHDIGGISGGCLLPARRPRRQRGWRSRCASPRTVGTRYAPSAAPESRDSPAAASTNTPSPPAATRTPTVRGNLPSLQCDCGAASSACCSRAGLRRWRRSRCRSAARRPPV